MKTININRIILLALFFVMSLPLYSVVMNSQVVYDNPQNTSGSFTLLPSDCSGYWYYYFDVSAPANTLIKINYNFNQNVFAQIYTDDGTYVVNNYGPYSGTGSVKIGSSGKFHVYIYDCSTISPSVFSFRFLAGSYSSTEDSYIHGNSIVDGSLGIGTLIPKGNLDVEGTGYFNNNNIQNQNTLKIANSTQNQNGNYGISSYITNSSAPVYGIYSLVSGGGSLNQRWAGYFSGGDLEVSGGNLKVSGNSYLTGNVGIGIAIPAAGLHVTKFNNSSGSNIVAIFGADYNSWTNFGGITGGGIRGDNSGYLVIDSNPKGTGDKNLYFNFNSSANILMARGGGNVGIGVNMTLPSAKLDVNGIINNNADIQLGIAQVNSYVKINTSSRSWWTGVGVNSGDNRFEIYDATTQNHALTIGTDGNVGIGIGLLQAAYKLEVKGTIHANEVIVDVNGAIADYVFKPSYKLMPLSQVEQYVTRNSHLPEIPSADEITKKGMSMGEMQNKLLQKVEELTLYVIEQQKKIDDLEKRIK